MRLKFYPNKKRRISAQTLALEIYKKKLELEVEIGTILADRDPETREKCYSKLELVRLVLPRRTYTDNHIRYIAAAKKCF